MKTIIFIFSFIILFVFAGCGTTGTISPEVCEYTAMSCELNQYLCEQNILPQDVCYWSNLICDDLAYLCDTTLTTENAIRKATLKTNLHNYRKSLNEFINKKQNNE